MNEVEDLYRKCVAVLDLLHRADLVHRDISGDNIIVIEGALGRSSLSIWRTPSYRYNLLFAIV